MRNHFYFHADVLVLAGVSIFFALLLWVLHNPTSLDDGLRHFAMARLMAERGVVHTNGWQEFLHHGYLSTMKVDPWFLSNVLLVPFTVFSIDTGLKLFSLLQLLLVGTSAMLVFRSINPNRIQSAVFLLILFFGDQQFLGRLLLARPFGLITACAILAVWIILEHRFLLLGITIALSVLLSQLFVFVVAIAGIGCIWLLIQQRYKESLYALSAIVIGCVAGLLLHPHAGEYLVYLYDAFIRIPFLNAEVELSAEMQSGLMNISAVSVIAGLGVAALLAVFDVHRACWKMIVSHQYIYLFGVCLFLLPMFMLWVRTIDLLWPMIVFALADLWRRQYANVHEYLEPLIHLRAVRAVFLLLVLAQIVAVPYTFIRDDADKSLREYAALSALPPQSTVLNIDWNRFFAYVAVRPDLSYAMGIDPVFTYLTDPRATEITRILRTNDVVPEDRTALLKELWHIYPSDYIVLYKQTFGSTIAALGPDWNILSSSGAVVTIDAKRSDVLNE